MSKLTGELGLLSMRKARAEVTLTPKAKRDWQLSAKWGVTVVQSCVVTLDPVTTRLEGQDSFVFTANMPEVNDAEAEMPGDETLEPLTESIDLNDILQEMIALALPTYPRADGAEMKKSTFAADGITPMSDDDAKPFAGLASLKEKLAKDDG